MATTPKKLVHWALDTSFSQFGSPFSDTSSESTSSASSLQYINSQLLAHGFTHSPGLSLDGLGKEDGDKVVKCLIAMLGQRIDDISRSEELTTKLRTLSYDHERIVSMHKAATDRAANAEREMHIHKSRLATMTRTLQSVETAHKHTTSELQRTRNLLQSLRSTHQAEIKKIEKEKDRMIERWSRLSDAQIKAAGSASGMKCANLEVVESPELQLRGKGQNFLEVALDQAEQARKELFNQQRRMRGLIVSTANELQSVSHAVRDGSSENSEEPSPLTLTTLFPLAPADAAADKITSLITSIKEATLRLSETSATSKPSQAESTSAKAKESSDVERLQAIIDTLRAELDQAQKQSAAYASQTQALFDRFAEDQRLASGPVANISVESITVPARDEEKQRLDLRCQELEDERKKFTEAAVKLGKEKAALESERLKLLEEKRAWQVEKMLAELPPTPVPASTDTLTEPLPGSAPLVLRSPRRSPRKSPHRVKAPAAATRATKKARKSRRSSGLIVGLGATSSKSKVTPAYETEIIPSPSFQVPNFKTSMVSPQPQLPALPSAFMLPPPSPAAKLPSQGGATASATGNSKNNDPPVAVPTITIATTASDSALDRGPLEQPVQPIATSSSAPQLGTSNNLSVPQTPGRRPFPMAKPLASRMIHAYSPVKPSPLSRILMLANSPDSPENDGALKALAERFEDEDTELSPTPAPLSSMAPLAKIPAVNFDIAPPREKKKMERVADPKPGMAQKAKAQPPTGTRLGPLEKENKRRAKASSSSVEPPKPAPRREAKSVVKPSSSNIAASTSRTRVVTRPPAGKGGARRVPINSAEAASLGPGWKD